MTAGTNFSVKCIWSQFWHGLLLSGARSVQAVRCPPLKLTDLVMCFGGCKIFFKHLHKYMYLFFAKNKSLPLCPVMAKANFTFLVIFLHTQFIHPYT